MSEHNPRPWRVDSQEPYEVELQDANGRKVEGVRLWLDDADIDSNWMRWQNFDWIVKAVNARDRLAAQVETLRELLRECQPLAWDVQDTELSDRIDAALNNQERGDEAARPEAEE